MPFSDEFKRLSDTLKQFQVTYVEGDFITGVDFPVSDVFREDLAFMMREGVVDNSEWLNSCFGEVARP